MLNIASLPGDGIGPEVCDAALRVLAALPIDVTVEEFPFGGHAIHEHGDPLPAETLAACRAADAVLLGAAGLPEFDGAAVRPEQGLIRLRGELDVYANLRPARSDGIDLLIVRELVGGLYFGASGRRPDGSAFDTCEYSPAEIERIARRGFELARTRRSFVTSVDKANVLETSRLWREVVSGLAGDYPDVRLEHMLVDNAGMQLVLAPAQFDVILTENTFGDILSDVAAGSTGGLGVAASASLGELAPGIFEPVHGSAPDIAGQGIANPTGALRSVALLLALRRGGARAGRPARAGGGHGARDDADARPRRNRDDGGVHRQRFCGPCAPDDQGRVSRRRGRAQRGCRRAPLPRRPGARLARDVLGRRARRSLGERCVRGAADRELSGRARGGDARSALRGSALDRRGDLHSDPPPSRRPRALAESEIRVIRSHPVALEQCRRLLGRLNGVRAIAASTTADAAAQVAESDTPGEAAIASERAAVIYGLHVIAHDVGDHPEAFTRFVSVATHTRIDHEGEPGGRPSRSSPTIGPARSSARSSRSRATGSTSCSSCRGRSRTRPGSTASTPCSPAIRSIRRHASAFAEVRAHVRDLRVLGSYPPGA